MDREGFRSRMKQYKKAREENPGLKYWEWKDVPKYYKGTGSVTLKEKEDAFWRGDTQKMAELVEREGKQLTYVTPQSNMDEVVITANKPKQNRYSELDLAKDIAGFTPIGDAIDLYDAGKALYKGNYSEAVMLGAGLLLPNWLEKSGKLAYRYLRRKASKQFGAPNVEFYENLINDIITKPRETYEARKEGRYPLTFKERKKYLQNFHDADDYYRSVQNEANKNDIIVRKTMIPEAPLIGNKSFWKSEFFPELNINTRSTINSRSYNNFANFEKAPGVNSYEWPYSKINSHAGIRHRGSNILENPNRVAATLIHERQHSVTKNLPDLDDLTTFSTEKRYYVPAGYSEKFSFLPERIHNIFNPLNSNIDLNTYGVNSTWSASPSEWLSNSMKFRVTKANGQAYEQMSDDMKKSFVLYMYDLHGSPDVTKTTIKNILELSSIHGFAEGGEVEPDPMEVLERSRPKVAGIPINDPPVSGTDPIGEAMMWGLGGGAASVALRSLFPTYGATAAWLAFGDNNDNMLVVPKNPIKNTTPIETGLLNKEVRLYYADDVLPRDILTSEQDKLRFLNNNKNFEYDLYPSEYFNPGVVGHYDHVSDKIRLNDGYLNNKDLLDNVMSHEVNHRYNTEFPLDKEHSKILNRAYTVQSDNASKAARAATRQSEKRATNVNIRHKLQTDLRNSLGRIPTKAEMDNFIDSLSDKELLDRLGSASAYGAAYLMSIEDRADLVNQPADQYKKARVTALKKALKRIAMNEDNNDNNQNYA